MLLLLTTKRKKKENGNVDRMLIPEWTTAFFLFVSFFLSFLSFILLRFEWISQKYDSDSRERKIKNKSRYDAAQLFISWMMVLISGLLFNLVQWEQGNSEVHVSTLKNKRNRGAGCVFTARGSAAKIFFFVGVSERTTRLKEKGTGLDRQKEKERLR